MWDRLSAGKRLGLDDLLMPMPRELSAQQMAWVLSAG
jgi:hypothetical protein